MDPQSNKINYPRKIARILLKTVLFIFLFIVFIFLLLLTPPVQRFLTAKVETYLGNKLQTKVEIGRIAFGLSGKVSLENVYIEDRSKDTLVSGGNIRGHLDFFKLFSNEVQVKDLELQNVTAKIKRTLPDTVFNFQFIVDAFTSEKQSIPDTAQSPPMKLDISDVTLENINLTYNDVVSGSDMFAHIGNASATIDTLDPYNQHFDIPTLIARNVQARIRQFKPLLVPESMAKEVSDAVAPKAMKLSVGTVDLNKIAIQYANDVSAFYSNVNIGQLKSDEKLIDLQNNKVYLNQLALNNSKIAIRLGKKEAAKVVVKEVKQEVKAQKEAGWDFKIDRLLLNNNELSFDNDNMPSQPRGMDFNHLLADDLTLNVENFVMNTDSIGGNITKGTVKEKSGFQIDEFHGDILYAYNQTYFRDLYIKTPGSEIKRGAELKYASYDALARNFPQTMMNIDLVDSRIQVKDILALAPQLRSNPALSNPNDVWYLNIVGNGTLNRLYFESLKFSGLRNTQINAQGTLVGLMNPKEAGGNFTIYRLHTTQSDLALFTGQRLSTPQINVPEEFDINGTIIGNAGSLNTNLNVSTSSGFIGVRGRFSNIMNPNSTTYNATIRTASLRLGTIMRKPDQFGNVTGNFTFNGKGLSPETINTKFSGNISSFGYNRYQYRNIKMSGSLKQTVFSINADINDPNADMNFVASGNFSSNPSFKVNGMIDSLKTMPLHFTPDPYIFRGKIDGTVSNITADNMDADVLITKGLFVSGNDRLPLDTVQLTAGRTDTGNFIRLRSDIANGQIAGQYRLADLGYIFQNSIQPYFTVSTSPTVTSVQPYNFSFNADVVYTPILTAFMPGLTTMEPLHAEGRFSSNNGMTGQLTSPYIVYNGNTISNADVKAYTAADGLHFSGNIARIQSGSSLDMYNIHLNATALNNNIDFNVGVDDQNSRNKYFLSGLLTQPSSGTYSVHLRPDSLLLNYEKWTVSPDNQITISPTSVIANDFTLQQGTQKLSLNSLSSVGSQPLELSFTEFRLATITGFLKSDSLLIDGKMNGTVTFRDLLKQPLFTSDLTINDLSLRQDTIGNVNLKVSSSANDVYTTNVTVTGKGNDISLTGTVTPSGKDIAMDLNLDVKALQLHSMEGALAKAITNASGAINGSVKIGGTTSKPDIKGDLNFDNASFAITMLGSQFRINNETLRVTEKGFVFDNFTIRDSSNNALNIDGSVATSNFINYNFDLDVSAANFEVLNNTKAQNKLYYGKLNVSSNLHIGGNEIKPVVDGSLTVNDGTNLFVVVPTAEPGVVDREGIVQFVDMDAPENDTLFVADTVSIKNVLGMDIAVNIEVRKEAVFNVVIDEANGDFVNVRGESVLTAGVDPSGKITLVGSYTVEEGSYQISYNFLQRKFEIEKGSTITWTGEPTTALLNITAVYIANTAPIDLVQDQISASTNAIRNTYMQKLPFEIHLNLTGELLKPVVDFDIVLPQDKNYGVSNDIVTAVQARLDQIRQDEGEINKQVFSLLLMGRFVGENPFQSAGGGFSAATYARESASRLLTEQLNQLAANLIEGVDLNFDVVSTDDYTTGERRNRTDLNVGVSKRLLNDRLKLTVGSDFELQGPQNSNQRSNNIAGNIAIDYSLSKDGRYLLRFYRSNDYEGMVDGYIIETGASFILSVDYNRVREILHKRKQRVLSTTTNNTARQ